MLFFRTKISANNEMMYRKGRKKNEEGWSYYIADELFTEREVHDMNLNMDYLEPVEISRRQTHYQGCYRVANFDANISPVKYPQKNATPTLSPQAKAEIQKRLNNRSLYKPHKKLRPTIRPTIWVARCKTEEEKPAKAISAASTANAANNAKMDVAVKALNDGAVVPKKRKYRHKNAGDDFQ